MSYRANREKKLRWKQYRATARTVQTIYNCWAWMAYVQHDADYASALRYYAGACQARAE